MKKKLVRRPRDCEWYNSIACSRRKSMWTSGNDDNYYGLSCFLIEGQNQTASHLLTLRKEKKKKEIRDVFIENISYLN